MKIFLSYGHDEYESLAKKIKLDLEQEGFEVWMDKERIRGSADWENAIEKGINSSDWVVLLMTEHSVRRPDGVCLDEISYARFLGKNIAPIMIQEVKPPLCIARIQWIDMKNFIVPGKAFFDEESYLKRKEELIDILRGLQRINYETKQVSLREYLNPLDNDVYSEYFIREFFGREKLLNKYNAWINTDDRVLWIRGDAGSGKTSFIAHLSKISEEIQAVHFCRYNDNERANPKRAIMSLAYYMSTQIPAYREELLKLNDLSNLIEKSTNRLFEYLIIEPLRKIPYQSHTMVLVIDALDEANLDGRNELADVIYHQFIKTPEWIKLIVTSRNDASLKRKLSKFTNIDISENTDENYSDIHGYLSLYLHDYLPKGNVGKNILNILTDKSQGLFLYAKTVTDAIRKGQLSIDKIEEFPDGLTGVYLSYFNRIFDQEQTYSYKKDIRPIMELLCSTCSPLKPENICEILDIDEYDMEEILELIQEMFPVRNNCIEPLHKSIIDWLSDSQLSGQYRVSIKKGHARISDYLLNNPKLEDYSTKYLCRHLIASLNYQKATTCLCDLTMQNKRIAIMGLDSAIRNYLYEILLLKSGSSSLVSDVFESRTFTTLFSKYRKYLYNSGLYFELKKCNFSEFLKTKKEDWDTDAEIGICYYYYITEDFNSTIDLVKHLLSTRELSFVMREELLNLIGLCYRKHVDFDLSKQKFELAYTIGKDNQEYYYQSTSLINLGKIAYHELDWNLATNYNRDGIKCLETEIEVNQDQDYRITLMLFLAEYHRLIAECLIWKCDINNVEMELEKAAMIYNQITNRDRYYIRYLYTSSFSKLIKGDYQGTFEDCEILFKQARSDYDKSQILYYQSIAALKMNKNKKAAELSKKAYQYALNIEAWLEAEEIKLIISMSGATDIENNTTSNPFIKKWIVHVRDFIEKL